MMKNFLRFLFGSKMMICTKTWRVNLEFILFLSLGRIIFFGVIKCDKLDWWLSYKSMTIVQDVLNRVMKFREFDFYLICQHQKINCKNYSQFLFWNLVSWFYAAILFYMIFTWMMILNKTKKKELIWNWFVLH